MLPVLDRVKTTRRRLSAQPETNGVKPATSSPRKQSYAWWNADGVLATPSGPNDKPHHEREDKIESQGSQANQKGEGEPELVLSPFQGGHVLIKADRNPNYSPSGSERQYNIVNCSHQAVITVSGYSLAS